MLPPIKPDIPIRELPISDLPHLDDTTSLKAEIARLQTENDGLRAAAALPDPTAPDDLASALRQSLDRLQSTLAAATNATSGFAVKSMDLVTNVHIAVTPLGVLQYRFPALNDRVDPNALSRVSLSVVPVPRTNPAGVHLDDQRGVDFIPGLTPDQIGILHANGIDTAVDFISAGTRARSSFALTSLLKTDRQTLASFVDAAHLTAIRGLAPEQAEAIRAAGFKTLGDIAVAGPQVLADRAGVAAAGASFDLAAATRVVDAARAITGLGGG